MGSRAKACGMAFLCWCTAAWAGLNPANPGLPVARDVYGTGTTYASNAASALCVDCHTANPKPTSGTHFVLHHDGAALRNTSNEPWEKLDEWGGSGSGRWSKYGLPAAPAAPTSSGVAQAGHLLCESCHNLLANVDGGNNLLAPAEDLDEPAVLCEGCHAPQAAGPPGHHAMTGDTVGADSADPAAHSLTLAHVRTVPSTGSEVTYTATGINCLSCHRVHGAAQQTGARCLKRGSSAAHTTPSDVFGGAVNVSYHAPTQGQILVLSTGDTVPGIDRQADIDGDTAPAGDGLPRLVTNSDPLCDACHLYND